MYKIHSKLCPCCFEEQHYYQIELPVKELPTHPRRFSFLGVKCYMCTETCSQLAMEHCVSPDVRKTQLYSTFLQVYKKPANLLSVHNTLTHLLSNYIVWDYGNWPE